MFNKGDVVIVLDGYIKYVIESIGATRAYLEDRFQGEFIIQRPYETMAIVRNPRTDEKHAIRNEFLKRKNFRELFNELGDHDV